MIAYVLCAGFGTRMRPLTDETPKSLLPVGGRPILDRLLENLRPWSALDAVHVVVNHRHAPQFEQWADDWKSERTDADTSLTVHDDGVRSPDEQLGAVGDLEFLLTETGMPQDGALVTGGDSLYRFPVAPILESFTGAPPRVLALYEPDPRKRAHSSVLQLDGSHVTGLVENPDAAASERICPSFHLLSPGALERVEPYLNAGGDPDTLGTFIDGLAQRQRVEAVRLPLCPSLRLHCNTPEDLRHARTVLDDEPRHVLDEAAVRECLPENDR